VVDQQETVATGTGFANSPLHSTKSLHNENWDVNLSQPLLDLPAWFSYQSGKATSAGARAQLSYEEQELMVRVVEHYVDALRAGDNLATSREEEKAYKEQLDQADSRFHHGAASITDVDQAQVAYESSVAQRISDEGDLRTSLDALTVLTGKVHSGILPLGKDFPVIAPEPQDIEGWAMAAQSNNFQLQAATLASVASGKTLTARKLDYYPKVTGSLSYQQDDVYGDQTLTPPSPFVNPPGVSTHTRMAMIKATVPFDTNGITSSAKRQAQAQYEASLDQKEDLERNVMQEARKRYIAANSDAARTKARSNAIAAAGRAVDAMREGYKHGTRNMADVLLAARQLSISRREYAKARYDYIVDSVHLKEASGQLSPADIFDLNRWLEEKPAASPE